MGYILLGAGVGAYGTLIGAGGGFVLMPLLILLYPEKNPEILTSISLAVVFFNALSGSGAYAMMKRVDYKSGLLFAAAAIPGAVIGALNTSFVPRRFFDMILGGLLICGSVFLSFDMASLMGRSKTKAAGFHVTRNLTDTYGKQYEYSFNPVIGVILSMIVGYVSSFLGIGGGIIHVPVMTFFLSFPVHIATATSHFVLAIMALAGTIVHIVQGNFSQGVHLTISLAIGAVIGAQAGAHLSEKIKGRWIIRSLSLALGIVGIRIITAAI